MTSIYRATATVPGRERGRPEHFRSMREMCEWLAGQTGQDARAIFEARARDAAAHGRELRWDDDLDTVRRKVTAALDAPPPPPPRRRPTTPPQRAAMTEAEARVRRLYPRVGAR